uniref:peptidyl-tRNA hydrolase n=1 Tax=Parastrongyloides trichosuri TaxID=131310 RepID=A0A0N4Z8R4_PARTI
MSNNSTWKFIKKGLPFFAIVFGGAYGLHFFQKVRYDFRQVKQEESAIEEVKTELHKAGVKLKDNVTVDSIFQEINEIDTENWENIRGPRDFEDNQEYLRARQKQQQEAAKIRKEKKLKALEEEKLKDTVNEKQEEEVIENSEIIISEEEKYYSEVVTTILEFGICDNIETASLAAKRTYPLGAEAAINWIIDRSNESDFAESLEESSDEEEDMGGYLSQPGVLTSIEAITTPIALRKYKMVLVVNMSLNMGKGKLAAQVGHAVLGTYKKALESEEGKLAISRWERYGQAKVVLKGKDTEGLMDLFKEAKDKGQWAYIVTDAGYTQIPAGSRTVVGIFGKATDVDEITGSLKLL